MLWKNHRRRGEGAAMETLERRRLLTTTVVWSYEPIGTYTEGLYADVQFGDNGYLWGMPTIAAGSLAGGGASNINIWDPFLEDGLETDWTPLRFSANVAGPDLIVWGAHHEEDYNNTVEWIGDDVLTSIGAVYIRAGVFAGGLYAGFKELEVNFYRQGILMETVNIERIEVDSLDYSFEFAESRAEIRTDILGIDEVQITGMFRMMSDVGAYPGPMDVFGQILLFNGLT